MASMVTVRIPAFVANPRDALSQAMARSQVDVERVTGTNRYCVTVLSPRFRGQSHRVRQDKVWDIAEKHLKPDELLRISMILTLSPEEMAGATR